MSSGYKELVRNWWPSRSAGFTLIEIAVVLVIFGILATAGLRLASSALTSASYRDTRQKMAVVKEALVSYLRSNNRLPCPDTKAGFFNTPSPGYVSFSLAAPPDGIENRNQTAGLTPDTTVGCDRQFGVLPYATLGLSAETATDGFGNLFSYYLTAGYGWSSSGAGAQSSMQGSSNVVDKDANGVASLPRQAVVVVLSYGLNGFGALTSKGTLIAPPLPSSTDELVNSAGNSPGNSAVDSAALGFVNRSGTDDSGAVGGAFDDVVMALSANDLVGALIAERSLQSLGAKIQTAKQDISAIEAAIVAFVVSNGRFPSAATANGDGQASGLSRGEVPWSTLGVPRLDPWDKPYQYAVSASFLPSYTKLTSGLGTINFREHPSSPAAGFSVPFVVYSSGQNNSPFFVDGLQNPIPCTVTALSASIPPQAPQCVGQNENHLKDGSTTFPFVRAPLSVMPSITDARLYYDDVIDYLPTTVIDAKMP